MFNLIKLGVLSVMFPDTAKDLAASLVALLPEQSAKPRTDRIMVRGPRGPYYVEKKYLTQEQLGKLT